MKLLYLAVDLGCLIVPLLFSFHPKIKFYKQWKYFFPANALVALIFIVWDMYFTHLGIWGFNPLYLTGIQLYNLPIEEILFFFCVPYASLFTYHALNTLVKAPFWSKTQTIAIISNTLIILLAIVGFLNLDKAYTSVTFISLSLFIAIHRFYWKSNYLGRFYLGFFAILLPFFISNGILTGSFIPQEIVWYNNHQNLDIRMATIPIEDTFYGMLMLLLNVTFFEWLKDKDRPKNISTP